MSIRVMTQVWEWSQAEGTSLLVMLALADFADDSGVCMPGISRVAKKARVSESTVRRIISEMEKKGELRKEVGEGLRVRGDRGTGYTNRYTIHPKGGVNLKPQLDCPVKNDELPCQKGHNSPVIAVTPKPSVEPSVVEPSGKARVSESDRNEFVKAWDRMPPEFPEIQPSDRLDFSTLSDPRWREALEFVRESDFYRGEGRQIGILTAGQFLTPKIFNQIVASMPKKVESTAAKAEKAAFKKTHGVPRYLINQALQVGVRLDPKTGKWSDGGVWYEAQKNPPPPAPNVIQIGLAKGEGIEYKDGVWSDGGAWWKDFLNQ